MIFEPNAIVVLTAYAKFPNLVLSSPNGQQFVSCKEVSSYLLSSFELQDAGQLKPVLADSEIQVAYQVGSGDVSHYTQSF